MEKNLCRPGFALPLLMALLFAAAPAHAQELGIETVPSQPRALQEFEVRYTAGGEIESIEMPCWGALTLVRELGRTSGTQTSVRDGVMTRSETHAYRYLVRSAVGGELVIPGTTAVVGGGDVALEDALYLANLCEKVYLIHRREGLRAAKELSEKVMAAENIEFLPYYEVKEIAGDGMVQKVILTQNQTGEEKEIELSGIFIAVGMEPQTAFVKDVVERNDAGYICAGEDCRTNVPGIYVAGDVRTKPLRQVITAVSDGAVAIASLEQDRN